ncbi:MAG: hypothetical protein Q9160_008042 [Pyrenula sp. 1 TL-2023]
METQKDSPPRLPPGTAVAIYFREDDGFLYLGSLGSGSHGQVALVRPVKDGESSSPTLFARKRALGKINRVVADVDETYDVREYKYPKHPHPSVPRALSLHFFASSSYYPGFPGHAVRFPFLNGGNLGRLCQMYASHKFHFPEAFMWSVLTKITRTLVRLHEDGVAHRDIAARNIFLNYENQTAAHPDVFLGDFGLAGTATISRMTADFKDLRNIMHHLAACRLGRYPPALPLNLEAIWGFSSYSNILFDTVKGVSDIVAAEQDSGILTNAVGQFVEQQFSRWDQNERIKTYILRGRLDWTRPKHPTMPLLFGTEEFATLIGGPHLRGTEIFGGGSMNPNRYVDYLGIAPPWEFAIVDRKTLSIVNVLTDEEVRDFAKAWGTIRDVDADEVKKRSGWRTISDPNLPS